MCPDYFIGTTTNATGSGNERIVSIDGQLCRVIVVGPVIHESTPVLTLPEDKEIAHGVHMSTYWQQYNKGAFGGKRKKK